MAYTVMVSRDNRSTKEIIPLEIPPGKHGEEDNRRIGLEILWRQDWFVLSRFEWATEKPHQFPDKRRYQELVAQGQEAIRADDIDRLRSVVHELSMIRIGVGGDEELLEVANILRG